MPRKKATTASVANPAARRKTRRQTMQMQASSQESEPVQEPTEESLAGPPNHEPEPIVS